MKILNFEFKIQNLNDGEILLTGCCWVFLAFFSFLYLFFGCSSLLEEEEDDGEEREWV